jgi:hypothetical protein
VHTASTGWHAHHKKLIEALRRCSHRRHWRYAHGVCWSELADEVEVVDVTGDHFSLLRQEPEDLAAMVSVLKVRLGELGWAEAVRRDRRQFAAAGEDIAALDRWGTPKVLW